MRLRSAVFLSILQLTLAYVPQPQYPQCALKQGTKSNRSSSPYSRHLYLQYLRLWRLSCTHTAQQREDKNTTTAEEIPSFGEFKESVVRETNGAAAAAQRDAAGAAASGDTATDSRVLAAPSSHNFASSQCGAKVLDTNSEVVNAENLLSPSADEYMNSPCSVSRWFVVQLCDSIIVKSLEIGSLELFSSKPKMYRVYISEKYPSGNWRQVGVLHARDEKSLQSFQLDTSDSSFIKYIKVEMVEFYGTEHFCPLTSLRVYGVSIGDDDEPQAPVEQHQVIAEPPVEETPEVIIPPDPTPPPHTVEEANRTEAEEAEVNAAAEDASQPIIVHQILVVQLCPLAANQCLQPAEANTCPNNYTACTYRNLWKRKAHAKKPVIIVQEFPVLQPVTPVVLSVPPPVTVIPPSKVTPEAAKVPKTPTAAARPVPTLKPQSQQTDVFPENGSAAHSRAIPATPVKPSSYLHELGSKVKRLESSMNVTNQYLETLSHNYKSKLKALQQCANTTQVLTAAVQSLKSQQAASERGLVELTGLVAGLLTTTYALQSEVAYYRMACALGGFLVFISLTLQICISTCFSQKQTSTLPPVPVITTSSHSHSNGHSKRYTPPTQRGSCGDTVCRSLHGTARDISVGSSSEVYTGESDSAASYQGPDVAVVSHSFPRRDVSAEASPPRVVPESTSFLVSPPLPDALCLTSTPSMERLGSGKKQKRRNKTRTMFRGDSLIQWNRKEQ